MADTFAEREKRENQTKQIIVEFQAVIGLDILLKFFKNTEIYRNMLHVNSIML